MGTYTLTDSSINVDEWAEELLGYTVEMSKFGQMDPGEVLQKLSSFSARASYMRLAVARSEHRKMQAFRSRQVEPFLQEAQFQFKVWSRFVSTQQQDWEMARGY